MHIDLGNIFVICVIAGLCYYVNEMLNKVPLLKTVVTVIIVVVAVLLLLQSVGLINTNVSVSR